MWAGTGKVPTYQNKDCKGYYLPLDNGMYAFEWISNLQVICPVHLKPTAKNRTYQLPAPDKKTLIEALSFEKEVGRHAKREMSSK